MDERAVVTAVPEPRRGLRLGVPVTVLLGICALLLVIAALPRPLDRDEADAALLAQSLLADGDAVAGEPDLPRRAALELDDSLSGVLPGPGEPFSTPLLYGLLQAPWVALGGAALGRAFQVLLLAAAAAAAVRALARRAGRDAAWLPLVTLLGSATFVYALRLWAEALLMALVAFAFAIAEGRRRAPVASDELPDLYPEVEVAPRPGSLARWAGVGALLGAVASAAPWTLPLLWPAAARVPGAGRRRGVALLLAAAALMGGGLWFLSQLTQRDGGIAAAAGTMVEQVVEPFLAPPAPATLGWNLVYALVGRHLGLLFYCGPLVLLAAASSGGRGGGPLWAAAGLSLVLLVALRPYDLAGSDLTVGLRAYLPVLGALWLAPVRPPSRLATVLTMVWASAFLWPAWLSPHRPLGEDGEPCYVPSYLAPWVPLETTQPRLPFGEVLPFGEEGRLVLLGGEPVGRGLVAAVPAGRWVELLVAVPGELGGLWVEAGEQAGAELPLRGGEVTEVMFRPDGGVSFVVQPRGARARHPLPEREGTWSFYHLSLRFPGPDGERFTIRLRPG